MDNVQLLTPNTVLTLASTGMTAADGADTFDGQQLIGKFLVPDGEVIGIPRMALIIAKMYTDASGTQLGRYSEIGLGLITPSDPNRVVPIGNMQFSYTDYYDLSTADQRNPKYKERFVQELCRPSCPVLVINQDETLVIMVYNATLGVDVSESMIEIPIYRGRPGNITEEMKWRRLEIGR